MCATNELNNTDHYIAVKLDDVPRHCAGENSQLATFNCSTIIYRKHGGLANTLFLYKRKDLLENATLKYSTGMNQSKWECMMITPNVTTLIEHLIGNPGLERLKEMVEQNSAITVQL